MLLDLGSGTNPAPPPWLTVDCVEEYKPDVVADIGALPFGDHSAERMMASHVLEHIPLDVLGDVLTEWRRVLMPGGTLMLVGPDIDRAIAQNEPHWLLEQIIAHGDGPGGHAWTCSEGVLGHLLHASGWTWSSRDVATVRAPEWPNPQPDAAWQLAMECWPR